MNLIMALRYKLTDWANFIKLQQRFVALVKRFWGVDYCFQIQFRISANFNILDYRFATLIKIFQYFI